MRERKYRIWDAERKQMSYRDMDTLIQFGWPLAATIKAPQMDYTGQLDKNGTEIWESDIVEDRFSTRYEVFFEDGCFMVNYDNLVWLIRDNGPIEVIGNIYANPGLLDD